MRTAAEDTGLMAQGHSKVRVIKRYANRKLYDMSESCYITHDEIATVVRNGEDVRIIDNRTKEDLTTQTLTQILFDKERRQKKSLPLTTLRSLFQSGENFIQKHIAQPVTILRDEAEENLRKVFGPRPPNEELFDDEAAETEPFEPIDDAEDDGAGAKPKGADAVRDWLENSQKALEATQKTLEER